MLKVRQCDSIYIRIQPKLVINVASRLIDYKYIVDCKPLSSKHLFHRLRYFVEDNILLVTSSIHNNYKFWCTCEDS